VIEKRYDPPAPPPLLREVRVTDPGNSMWKTRALYFDSTDLVHLDVAETGHGFRRAIFAAPEFQDLVRGLAELCGLKIDDTV
jgi:hypothetical protein